MSDRPVVICFAGDVWDANPHSRHHLMRRLAGDWEVLFVEGVPMRGLGRPDRAELGRAWRKLRLRGALRQAEPGLHVLRPLPLPPSGRIGRAAQLTSLRLQVAFALRRLGLRGPRVSWFSLPNAAPLRGRFGERGSLFFYQDRYAAFPGVDAPRIRAHVAALARGCELTAATSAALAEELRALGADPLLLRHGVDVDRFADEPPPPPDLAGLEPPLVGFAGLIDEYVSVPHLLAVADRLERGTVVLLGRANAETAGLARHPRIALVGPRPYEAMPAYLAAMRCCLIPFALTPLTEAANPIKLREYLAAGRPVVSTPLPEVAPYADVVALAGEPAAFAEAVAQALAAPDGKAERARRRARVASESWDAVAAQLAPHLDALLARGTVPAA